MQSRLLMQFIVTCPFLGQRVPFERTGHTPERLGEFRITNRDGDAAAHRRRDSHIILVRSFPGSVCGKIERAALGADRAPGRCRAGRGLLGGKDPPTAYFSAAINRRSGSCRCRGSW